MRIDPRGVAAAVLAAVLASASPAAAASTAQAIPQGAVVGMLNQFAAGSAGGAAFGSTSWTANSMQACLAFGLRLVLPADQAKIVCRDGDLIRSLTCANGGGGFGCAPDRDAPPPKEDN